MASDLTFGWNAAILTGFLGRRSMEALELDAKSRGEACGKLTPAHMTARSELTYPERKTPYSSL